MKMNPCARCHQTSGLHIVCFPTGADYPYTVADYGILCIPCHGHDEPIEAFGDCLAAALYNWNQKNPEAGKDT